MNAPLQSRLAGGKSPQNMQTVGNSQKVDEESFKSNQSITKPKHTQLPTSKGVRDSSEWGNDSSEVQKMGMGRAKGNASSTRLRRPRRYTPVAN